MALGCHQLKWILEGGLGFLAFDGSGWERGLRLGFA
jgi:hypothetical protein